ncbi:gas vesicle accessory protein GvpU [Rhodanobacter aciditrophus]|uniref:Gas vesicle accessory protein GvpU n=1 Tax=Rhodanobacter aciditrophus TaxID=1623218 RepID=A0ABW4B1T2_9GAMM
MSENKASVTEVVNVDDKDWFLQDLIEIANSGKMSFDITLTVGGFLVSGTLIGGKEYFQGFGEEFSFGLKGEAAEKVKAAFSKNGDVYANKSEPALAPSYIHLKNAHFFHTSGTPVPENRGVWWRGRISEVSGFSLGALINDGP